MKYKSSVISSILSMLAQVAHAEQIGSIDTVFKMFRPGRKTMVEMFDDPDVTNMICYVSRAETGGIRGGLGLVEGTSDAAISCQQVGLAELSDRIKNGKTQGEMVFRKHTSLVFKSLQVARFYGTKRNVLAYLAYPSKVVDGSPKNAISMAPIMSWRQQRGSTTQQPLIWSVEDERGTADTLIYMLQQEGFSIEAFECGFPVPEKSRQQCPDAIVLGVGLSDISGSELRRHLLEHHPALPTPFLVARNDEIDRLSRLEIGVDDCVAKPFSPRKVCARACTLLRRVQKFSTSSSVTRCGDFGLNELAARITRSSMPLNLTRYELLLLKTSLMSPGRIYSRQQLMDLVQADAQDTFDRAADTHTETPRTKLRAINPEFPPINTHRDTEYNLRNC